MQPTSISELLTDWVKQCEKSWLEKKREDFRIVNNHTNNLETEYNNLEIELGDINDYKIMNYPHLKEGDFLPALLTK